MGKRGAILTFSPTKIGANIERYWRKKEGKYKTFKVEKGPGGWTLKGFRKGKK